MVLDAKKILKKQENSLKRQLNWVTPMVNLIFIFFNWKEIDLANTQLEKIN